MKLKAYIAKLQKLEAENPGLDVNVLDDYLCPTSPAEPRICNFEKGTARLFVAGVQEEVLRGKEMVIL